jgi:hypothetical protein
MRDHPGLGLAVACILCMSSSSGQVITQADSTATSRMEERASSSESNCDTMQINSTRLLIVGGTLVAGMAAIHIYQSNGWWKDNRTSFHFQEDLKYGRSVDKIGHFYGAAVLSFVFKKSLEWADFPERKALFWGAGAAALFQTYVEMEDGFSAWGFDRVDFASDIAGAAWPIAQYYSPFLQNFDFKFSYHPSSELHGSGGVGFKGQKHIIFDDYEGQTLWLSMKTKNVLSRSLSSYWPSFLCLAVGYGVRDIVSAKPNSVLFLGLDYDFTKIIPDDTPFLKMLGEALNYIRFPAPAVKISPNTVWYGIYF